MPQREKQNRTSKTLVERRYHLGITAADIVGADVVDARGGISVVNGDFSSVHAAAASAGPRVWLKQRTVSVVALRLGGVGDWNGPDGALDGVVALSA